ncbi:hypothetical protein AB0G73_27785 [Streptomyces sp. NPDC020719]|uniref:hypothetical protein n=1 Tax=Streptomyces sp. NPDC020719 TaxID=3154896 RepID=UPI0033D12BC1
MAGLTQVEIERYRWDTMKCGCGRSADHLRELLERMAEGSSAAVRALDGHAFVQSNLMAPAPAVASVSMAILSDGAGPRDTKDILWLLLSLISGEEDGDSVETSLYWNCIEKVRDGIWLIYRELVKSASPECKGYAIDILEIVEGDPMRLSAYRGRDFS